MAIGGILTPMVTPFDAQGRVDEEATARLVAHLIGTGSDGLVVAGTTGEGATLTDEEQLRLFALVREEAPDAFLIGNTGTNDTAHSVRLTERAAEIGMDAVMAVTPYYVKPNERGLKAHFAAIAAAADLPVVLYNIPSRCVVDMSNDFLRELAEIENVAAVKQSRYEDLAPIEGLDLLAGNDDTFADILDMGGTGGVLVAAHLVGREQRRMIDEPDARHEIHERLLPLYEALFVTANPTGVKAALNMVGPEVGGLRLPMVEASDEEAAVVRAALERLDLLSRV